MPEIVQEIGAAAGIAAVVGLAVLSALYFSQARDVKRLREWAGRAPERSETGVPTPTAVPGRAAGVAPPVPSARPAATPAAPAATGAGPATAQQSRPGVPATAAAAAAAGAAGGGTASGGASAAASEGASRAATKPATPADSSAKPGNGGAAPDGADAAPDGADAKPDGTGAKPDGSQSTGAPAAGNQAAAAKPAAESPNSGSPSAAASSAPPAASPAGSPAGPPSGAPAPPAGGARPATPAGASGPPPVAPPVRRAPVPSRAAASRGVPQETAIIPPRRSRPWYSRIGARYVALGLIGLLVGGGAAYGVSQLAGGDDGGDPSDNARANSGETPSAKPKNKGGAVKPASVTVAVLNGTTVPGLAATLSDQVGAAGFKVGTITNFYDQQLPESVVQYAPGHQAEAKAVSRRVGIARREPVSAQSRALAGDATVVVIAGADKAP